MSVNCFGEKKDDEKEGFYFSICCCHCCHLFLSSGAGRGLSRTVAATLSREQRRGGGGGGGGEEREGGVGGGGEEEEDAVAAVRSRGCCPTSPPTEGWIFTLPDIATARIQNLILPEDRTRLNLANANRGLDIDTGLNTELDIDRRKNSSRSG